jgi:hypothetical protein
VLRRAEGFREDPMHRLTTKLHFTTQTRFGTKQEIWSDLFSLILLTTNSEDTYNCDILIRQNPL